MSLNSKLHRRVLFIFAVSILMISNLAAMDEKSEDGELEEHLPREGRRSASGGGWG